ncbi:MAG: S8 family serine peptidase [bacterium]
MSKRFYLVNSSCLIFLAIILIVSCSTKSSSPVTPNLNNSSRSDSGNSTLSGSASSNLTGYNPVSRTDVLGTEKENDGNPATPKRDPVYHSILNDQENYAPNEILLILNAGSISTDPSGKPSAGTLSNLLSLASTHGLMVKDVLNLSWNTVYRMAITDGTLPPDKANEINNLPEIKIAEPNYRIYFCEAPYFPNDPLWENPNDSDDDPRSTVFEQFGPSKIGASVCWNENKGSSDVVVCVLDSGVQVWHEDLENVMWHNPGEIAGNHVDDDLNGYVDDIYGWDTADDDADITEYNSYVSYHGTACSGVIAAEIDNNKGCAGIAPGVRIMGVKCDLSGGGGYTSSVIEGVDYAHNNGASVVSMSFRTYTDSQIMHDAMDAAWADGVILCGGAGNEDSNELTYPACWSCVVEVGGTSSFLEAPGYTPCDEIRISYANGFGWGSNWGPNLEIMAFGVHYITTYGEGPSTYWDGKDDFFFGGTSNATPMAAGSFALLKSFYPAADSDWLRERMRETSDDLYEPGFDINSGYGRVNLIRAVYGADRYESEVDPNGFVDLVPHDSTVYDSLNAKSDGDYIDTEDLYKYTAPIDGIFIADLDIFTWGENLDIYVYDDPSLAHINLLGSSEIDNHASSSREVVGVPCTAGQTMYVKVVTDALGDSTAYGLTGRVIENSLGLEAGSYPHGFIHQGITAMPVVWLDLSTAWQAHISEITLNMLGTMPVGKIKGMHLWRDSNNNGSLDGGDTHIADATLKGTNRFIFTGLYQEIQFIDSPVKFIVSVDLADITQDSEFSLVLDNYKYVSTSEGLIADYKIFPIVLGPWEVGVDSDPPTWDTTVGIQLAEPKYMSTLIRWNLASDAKTPPVKYNVYWTDTLPFDFGSANVSYNVSKTNGGAFSYKWLLTGLENDKEYFIAIRAEDQAGNEEDNTVYLAVTPEMNSDPHNPQVIGAVDTPGSAWEVIIDPSNPRVFVADYDSGVQIIDVTDPTNPEIVDNVPGYGISGIDFDGTYIYAVGDYGMSVINPDAPGGADEVGFATIYYALDVCIAGNWAYVTNMYDILTPVDITDPESPIVGTDVGSEYYGYGIDEQDGYLFIATYYKPRVYSLSNPASPSYKKTFGGNGAYEIDAEGDRLYVTYWGGNRFSIYDISNPADPSWLGGWTSNSGTGGSDIVLLNGYAYFGTNDFGIEVTDVTDPGSIFEIGQVATDGPDGMDTDGIYLFSAENEGGLKIII